MLAWIRRCTTKHRDACGSVGLSAQLPTRVLDIGDAQNNSIKLIESSGTTGRYLCLSHCWGDHQPLRTLQSNYTSHLSNIPWSSIPSTFQDAITLTRKLGFSHLWIDSLCIIQDSPSDWAAESRKMMSIYQNCFLTIAATSSPSSNTGLFLDVQTPAEISGLTSTGDAYAYHIRPSVQHFTRSKIFSDFDNRWPLLTRAWVLQERLLAPRVVHVAKPELFWECRACIDCECTTPGNPPPLDIGPLTTLKPDYWASITDANTFTYQHWWAIVEQYTSLRLSFKSDTFPALSGLVEHILSASQSAFPQGSYLSGLFTTNMPLDLLWRNNHAYIRHVPEMGPRPFVAPSWSWAS
ncbi:heterokaryon incompatibility protein-domain-containing protein, partial [Podospora aff. communis PSN243]